MCQSLEFHLQIVISSEVIILAYKESITAIVLLNHDTELTTATILTTYIHLQNSNHIQVTDYPCSFSTGSQRQVI